MPREDYPKLGQGGHSLSLEISKRFVRLVLPLTLIHATSGRKFAIAWALLVRSTSSTVSFFFLGLR